MMDYQQRIKQAFNRAVHSYDHNCGVQVQVGIALLQQLQKIHIQPQLAIDLGCGTGLVTEKLFTTIKPQFLYAIDFAGALLECAKGRLQTYNIKLEQQNFQNLAYPQKFDLVFSNMALHWAESLFATLQTINSSLQHQGIIAFSIPLYGTFHELPDVNKHRFYKKQHIEQWLHRCGYELIDTQDLQIIQKFDSLKQALTSIKAVGAHVIPSPITSRRFSQIKLSLIQSNMSFALTYCLGLFIGKKLI